MPLSSAASILGIAKEAVVGTAVPPTAFLPVKDIKPHINVIYLPDEGWRGSQAKTYGEPQGPSYAELEFSGVVYPDTAGWFLTGILGDITTTGASAPFSHAIALLNTGALTPSYTITDYNGFNGRQYAGFRFTEVTFKFAGNGLLEYTAKGIGRTYATTTKPTASYSAITQQAAWVGIATIVATPSSLITQGDLTIKRSGAPIHNVDGSQAPYDVFVGSDLEVTGSFTAVYEDDTLLTDYTAGTVVALDFNWQQGASAALTQVKLHMTQTQFTDATINRSQGNYVELAANYDAIANSTDVGASSGFSPIKATLQNALASGTYK
jgi:hypothetical protein